jgi:hypothetical protein
MAKSSRKMSVDFDGVDVFLEQLKALGGVQLNGRPKVL